MKHSIYQIDAFANRVFEGNPAAVVPLKEWLTDEQMQAIAEENNLAETAFFISNNHGYHIRWFTPVAEIKLCGHATLASAYVIFNILGYQQSKITFDSLSGPLSVEKSGDLLTLNFPQSSYEKIECPELLKQGLGVSPNEVYCGEKYLAIFDNEEVVANISPNHQFLKQLEGGAVIISAPSEKYDFVSRCFVPKLGIPEDPVTGSAHTLLTPFWAERLGKSVLEAKQISKRGGELTCELINNRVFMSGYAVKYLEGNIYL